MTPAQIVARQTADRMAHERMMRCVRACSGLSDESLEAGVVAKAREALALVAKGLRSGHIDDAILVRGGDIGPISEVVNSALALIQEAE